MVERAFPFLHYNVCAAVFPQETVASTCATGSAPTPKPPAGDLKRKPEAAAPEAGAVKKRAKKVERTRA